MKKWLGYNLYKKLWSITTGRPFTYLIRDIWHQNEYVMQAFWFYLGIVSLILVHNFLMPAHLNLWAVLKTMSIIWGIYTFGYVWGHLTWGKDYIKGQKG